jgi:hypothetical protein
MCAHFVPHWTRNAEPGPKPGCCEPHPARTEHLGIPMARTDNAKDHSGQTSARGRETPLVHEQPIPRHDPASHDRKITTLMNEQG